MHKRVNVFFIPPDDNDAIVKPSCVHCRRNGQYVEGQKKWLCPSCFDDLTPKRKARGAKNKDISDPMIATPASKKSTIRTQDYPATANIINETAYNPEMQEWSDVDNL